MIILSQSDCVLNTKQLTQTLPHLAIELSNLSFSNFMIDGTTIILNEDDIEIKATVFKPNGSARTILKNFSYSKSVIFKRQTILDRFLRQQRIETKFKSLTDLIKDIMRIMASYGPNFVINARYIHNFEVLPLPQ